MRERISPAPGEDFKTTEDRMVFLRRNHLQCELLLEPKQALTLVVVFEEF